MIGVLFKGKMIGWVYILLLANFSPSMYLGTSLGNMQNLAQLIWYLVFGLFFHLLYACLIYMLIFVLRN